MSTKKLSDKKCLPCDGISSPLESEKSELLLAELGEHWQLSEDGKSISRRFIFKGFSKAVYLSNLCAWLADEQGHHPDVSFGWGYCQVNLTTHTADSLTENDFIWAAKLNKLTDDS